MLGVELWANDLLLQKTIVQRSRALELDTLMELDQTMEEIRLRTWNIRRQSGKEVEVVKRAVKYKLELLGISTIKKKSKGQINIDSGYTLNNI